MCVDPLQNKATAHHNAVKTFAKLLRHIRHEEKKSFDKKLKKKIFRHPQTQNELLFITMLCFFRALSFSLSLLLPSNFSSALEKFGSLENFAGQNSAYCVCINIFSVSTTFTRCAGTNQKVNGKICSKFSLQYCFHVFFLLSVILFLLTVSSSLTHFICYFINFHAKATWNERRTKKKNVLITFGK